MLPLIRVCSLCRLPVHLHDVISRIRKTEAELAAEFKRKPTAGEIAEVRRTDAAVLYITKLTVPTYCAICV